MRLVTWNCWNGLDQVRGSYLHGLAPDLAVLPEATERPVRPDGADAGTYLWRGVIPNKGLGVAAFGATSIRPASADLKRVEWVLPVEVTAGDRSFLLLAIWTVRGEGRPSYAKQLAMAIDAYEPELTAGRAVLAGDVNCSSNTSDPRPFLRSVDRLQELGMVSAYHSHRGVDPSPADPGTLFWQWSEQKPFHCDLVFVPASWAASITDVEVGAYADWVAPRVSDHVPVIVDVAEP